MHNLSLNFVRRIDASCREKLEHLKIKNRNILPEFYKEKAKKGIKWIVMSSLPLFRGVSIVGLYNIACPYFISFFSRW